MEACLAESLEIVQGLDRKRDFKSEFKANLKELKSTRKFKKNKKEQLEKLKGKSLVGEFLKISCFFIHEPGTDFGSWIPTWNYNFVSQNSRLFPFNF